MTKLEKFIKIVDIIIFILMPVAIAMLVTPWAIYANTGVELFWLINSAFAVAFVLIAMFATWLTCVIINNVRTNREDDNNEE